jgi:YggT family protein
MIFLREALVYLISTLFGLYLLAVLLRFLLQWVRADFSNPVSQFVVAVTNPLLRPLRRYVPGYRGVDVPSLLLMFVVKLLEQFLVTVVASGHTPAPAGLLLLTAAGLLQFTLYVYFFAILVRVVLSWVSPAAYNPVTVILHRLTEPLLSRAQRLLPPVAGLDFSPILVLIGLQVCQILVIKPLQLAGFRLAGVMF